MLLLKCQTISLQRKMQIKALLFFLLLIVSSLAYAKSKPKRDRDWTHVINAARDLHKNMDTLDGVRLIYKLNKVKESIYDTNLDIPRKFDGPDRSFLINAFSLRKITDITTEKCWLTTTPMINNNFHRLNYLRLEPIMLNLFPLENIRTLIAKYNRAQYFLCLGALGPHFALKWKKMQANIRDIGVLKEKILTTFTDLSELAAMSLDEVRIRIVQSMWTHYILIEVKPETILDSAETMQKLLNKFNDDCKYKILRPLETLMDTYNRSRRLNRPTLESLYGDLIRLYDTCSIIENKFGQNQN